MARDKALWPGWAWEFGHRVDTLAYACASPLAYSSEPLDSPHEAEDNKAIARIEELDEMIAQLEGWGGDMTTEQNVRYKPGDVFVLTDGEYSDYHIVTMCRAVKAFDLNDEFARWAMGRQFDSDGAADEAREKFQAWLLVESGLVEEVTWRETRLEDLVGLGHLDITSTHLRAYVPRPLARDEQRLRDARETRHRLATNLRLDRIASNSTADGDVNAPYETKATVIARIEELDEMIARLERVVDVTRGGTAKDTGIPDAPDLVGARDN